MVIDVVGLDSIMKRFKKASEVDLKPFLNVAARSVRREAFVRAPKKTGYLRRSIRHRVEGRGSSAQGVVWTNTEYAPYLEFGTRKMLPRPFMVPALRSREKMIKRGLEVFLREQLKK